MATRIPFIATALALSCSVAMATEYGTVLSSTPVTSQVAVASPQCLDQQQLVQPPNSGLGAVVGAVIGGVAGNSVGGGVGRVAATGLGVVAGAAIGDRVETSNTPPSEVTVRHCRNAVSYENRVIGYDVIYEHHGQRYTTRMAQDPVDRIALNVSVRPAGAAVAATPTPVYAPPAVVVGPGPYPGYYGPYPAYYVSRVPPVTVAPRIVIRGAHHGYWR